jgi:hypothetical protein
LYLPDRRNAHHQKYCSKPECRGASRAASRRRWLAKPANRDYHRGGAHVARVRAWREAHPGYWRRKGVALQDVCPPQDAAPERVAHGYDPAPEVLGAPPRGTGADPGPSAQAVAGELLAAAPAPSVAPAGAPGAAGEPALQDVFPWQHPLFVGLVAVLTDALQEDIVPVMARLHTRGQAILGMGSGSAAKEA